MDQVLEIYRSDEAIRLIVVEAAFSPVTPSNNSGGIRIEVNIPEELKTPTLVVVVATAGSRDVTLRVKSEATFDLSEVFNSRARIS
jgi:hypothetical protein